MIQIRWRPVFLCLLLGLLALSPVSGQSIQISNTTAMAELPFIRVMANGDIMVIYCLGTHFNADAVLNYHIFDQAAGTWSGPTQAVSRAGSSAYPQLWKGGDGDLHMAYHDGNASPNREIYYARFDSAGRKWAGRTVAYVSSGVNSTWPRIQGIGDRLFIVWSHNYESGVGEMDMTMIENSIGGAWPVDQRSRLTISDTPQSVSIHGDFEYRDDKVYICWMDDNHNRDSWNIYYNQGTYDQGTETWSFGTAQRIYPDGRLQYYPALAVDENGVVHVLFSHKNNPVFHMRLENGVWSEPKTVSTGSAGQNMFAVLEYADGLLHTVIPMGTNVYYVRGSTDGTWTEPFKIHDGECPGYPGLDIDENGDAHVVFSDGDAVDVPRNIFYVKVALPGVPPTAAVSADVTAGPLPLTVAFDGSGSSDSDGKVIDYRWNFGDGTSASGESLSQVSHTFESEGTFPVTLTVLDNDLRTDTATIEIKVSSGPRAVITPSVTRGEAPLAVTFDGSSSKAFNGSIENWSWDFGDGTQDSGVSVSHVFQHGGRYIVTLTVTDNTGETGAAEVEIVVLEKPTAVFAVAPSLGRVPFEAAFDASASSDPDGTIESYIWNFGDGPIELEALTTHVFTTAGTIVVSLEVTDNDNLSAIALGTVVALDAPLAPLAVSIERLINRAFLFTDNINRVTWRENPENSGLFTIAGYRIYRRPAGTDDSGYILVGEVGGGVLSYDDRGFIDEAAADAVVYTVTALDVDGRESPFAGGGSPGIARGSRGAGSLSHRK